MTVTVYIDVYFIINFIMNGIILFLVSQRNWGEKCGRKKWFLMGLSATVGAMWACICLIFFLPSDGIWYLIQWIFSAVILTLIAFGKTSWRKYVENIIWFLIMSLIMNGILSVIDNGFFLGQSWPVSALVLCAVGAVFLMGAGVSYCRKSILHKEKYCLVTLHYQGKEKTLTALWDTGNQLYEPYHHQPVHVLSYGACSGWCDSVSSVIFIPFRSVGRQSGVLPGVQMDLMEVWGAGEEKKTYKKPWIAISREPLSAKNQYEMLLHGE